MQLVFHWGRKKCQQRVKRSAQSQILPLSVQVETKNKNVCWNHNQLCKRLVIYISVECWISCWCRWNCEKCMSQDNPTHWNESDSTQAAKIESTITFVICAENLFAIGVNWKAFENFCQSRIWLSGFPWQELFVRIYVFKDIDQCSKKKKSSQKRKNCSETNIISAILLLMYWTII